VSKENEPNKSSETLFERAFKNTLEAARTVNPPKELKEILWDFITSATYVASIFFLDRYVLKNTFGEEGLSGISLITFRGLELALMFKVLYKAIEEFDKLAKKVGSLQVVQFLIQNIQCFIMKITEILNPLENLDKSEKESDDSEK
jgi:hypothetical protein